MFPAMQEAAKQIKRKWVKLQDDNAPVHAWAWTPKGEWDDEERRNDDDAVVSRALEFK